MSEDFSSKRKQWDQELLDKFVKEILMEIAAHKHHDSAAALSVAKRLSGYLDEFVNSLEETPHTTERDAGLNGVRDAAPNSDGMVRPSFATSRKRESIGRNFVSRLRELVVLDYLNDETRPIALHEVQSVVASKGFQDSESAVISQLHRLHQNALIEKPDNMNGVYLITQEGRHHLARLRETHGAMLEEWLCGAASA